VNTDLVGPFATDRFFRMTRYERVYFWEWATDYLKAYDKALTVDGKFQLSPPQWNEPQLRIMQRPRSSDSSSTFPPYSSSSSSSKAADADDEESGLDGEGSDVDGSSSSDSDDDKMDEKSRQKKKANTLIRRAIEKTRTDVATALEASETDWDKRTAPPPGPTAKPPTPTDPIPLPRNTAPEKVMCPKGHAMRSYQQLDAKEFPYRGSPRIRCDACGTSGSLAVNGFHCDVCTNFDFCVDCALKRSIHSARLAFAEVTIDQFAGDISIGIAPRVRCPSTFLLVGWFVCNSLSFDDGVVFFCLRCGFNATKRADR
jgi:hypothetical protein